MVHLTLLILLSILIVSSAYHSMDHNMDNYLRSDHQTSTFLEKGETKILKYWSIVPDSYLSITVTPCGSKLNWTVQYCPSNDSMATKTLHISGDTSTLTTWRGSHMPRGLFKIHITALDKPGNVQVYTSTEPGGPQALISKTPRIRFQNQQRNGRLMVKWNQSAVDPHVTHYCLVVSSSKNYTSLCEAQATHYGNAITTLSSHINSPRGKKPKAVDRVGRMVKSKISHNEAILIKCVGPRLQYTLAELENGHLYNFDLFAVNQQTNFSFPFGSTTYRFNRKIKPHSLRDGKPAFVNLKKLDGKAVFRYKVTERHARDLLFYVMPCGGGVQVEVTLKGSRIVQKRRVDGYEKLLVRAPAIGQRYYIRVTSSNKEELRRTSGVEVLATTNPTLRYPLPIMPEISQVYQYSSDCDGITVGWLSSPDSRVYEYCVYAREGIIREMDGPKMSNQCGLETRMRKSADFAVRYCQDWKGHKPGIMTQRISQLKPGRNYVVQVTVRKLDGKALSYDLLQVQTKPICKENNTI